MNSLIITVGVGDLKVSNDSQDIIVTHGLGSCIGVIVYDHYVKVGGMLHYMLPESSMDFGKAKKRPFMFADTGIPLLFKSCYKFGAVKSRMTVKVVGGSQIMDESGIFNIGKRNYAALKEIFKKNNVKINAEDVGGSINRTIRLSIATGKVQLKLPDQTFREL
ncbi:putative chemoreceptor glutamine deamidase CheD 1 [Candidatus Magnetomoraceae bacterium gMMP-15]